MIKSKNTTKEYIENDEIFTSISLYLDPAEKIRTDDKEYDGDDAQDEKILPNAIITDSGQRCPDSIYSVRERIETRDDPQRYWEII